MTSRLKTVRFRFALSVAGLLWVVLSAFGSFVYVSLWHSLSASVDDSLRFSATQVLDGLDFENGQVTFSDSLPGSSDAKSGLTVRIFGLSGQITQSLGLYPALPVRQEDLIAARSGQSVFSTVTDADTQSRARVYTVPIVQENQMVGILQVAQSLEAMEESLQRLLTTLLVAGPALVLVAAFGGYFLAARALAPIDKITSTARRISAEDLSARLNLPATDDEVGRLAATFDAMLVRLDEAFRRERQFTADAAHELRTPLAATEAILGVMQERPRTRKEHEQALSDMSEETRRLRSLVEDLLRLARGDAQPLTVRERLDLSRLLLDVTESLKPLAEAKNLALTSDVPAGLVVFGDSDDLIRLFVNLLDNAIKYTEHGAIHVAAFDEHESVSVKISDSGIGIAPEHLPRLFDRFYRAESSRATPGAGLGLAIALQIARAHGGTIEISSTGGVGTTCTVLLPRP